MDERKPIGVFYEHPEWFEPLFAELDRRGLPYERIAAHTHRFDPDDRAVRHSLVVNRVSPSAYLRGHTSAIFHAQDYLAYLEGLGVPLVNGTRAQRSEVSKARQLATLAALGIPHPRSIVVNAPDQIVPAAHALAYPIIVKPNIGGSGALMQRFDDEATLVAAVAAGDLDATFGLDYTAIVQEFHPTQTGSIVRVEALDDQFFYAIRIYSDGDRFNLCPADICQVEDGADAPAPSAKPALRIEAVTPPGWVVEAVLRTFRESGIDIGGVEYLESARDGQIYLYDVNALSNFVTDAPRLVGFDPFARFVDYLERRAFAGAGRAVAGIR
jgi:hypothetical protein